MASWFRKNWWAGFLLIVIIIVILGVIRLGGGSTWFTGWGLQLWDWGWFWGQRPFHPDDVGALAFVLMAVLIIIVVIVIYFLRRLFFRKE